jgi:hypothetical protein
LKSFIKKAYNYKHIEWALIGFCFLFILASYLIFSLPYANATEEEKRIEEIEEERIEIDQDILQYNDDIVAARDNLKAVKKAAGESWDAVLDIKEAEKLFQEAKDNYQNARDSLFELLGEKSDLIKIIKTQIKESKIKKFDSSNLVKRIGINLSNMCETMLKNNFTTNCPTYKDMITLDSSDRNISGKFTTDDDGFFHRLDPIQNNSWKLYDFDETIRIFVDPPDNMLDRVRLITIMPNFDNYFVAGDLTISDQYTLINVVQDGNATSKAVNYSYLNKTQDFSRVIYHDRYIDNCRSAVINAAVWKAILPDTINFMRNDCDPKHTQFEEREVITPNYTSIDITTSPNYQAQWKLEEDMERCKVLC